MSRTIDERVVEMRFDNAQFERNVKTSMSTLDRLKSALKLDGATKGLDSISSKSIKSSGLDGMASSIQNIERRFSTLGIVGAEVIRKLTDTAMNFTGNVMSKVYDGIIGGGLRRAQNIENAHFQLQGILKDEEQVQAVMADAMDSVDQTAYGYDVAAKAASMFAASGLRAGEQMQTALKGITGVAAVTNSRYEDISNIFTKIAGQGRIMGDDLNQFAARGMNAAATLAQYYREVKGEVNMTEQGIRDLISDKNTNIYFEEFAKAMTWAFGDQAKKANETFTGSLENVKAALSRVGAKFFAPLIEQNSTLVKLFNTIRLRINDINKTMDPFAQKFSSMVLNMGKAVDEFLSQKGFSDKIAETFPKIYRIYANVINILQYSFKAFGSVIKNVTMGLRRFIPYDLLDRIGDLTGKMSSFTRTLKLSDEDAKNLRDTFRGVSAIFDIFGRVLKAVFGISKPLPSILSSLASWALKVTGSLGRMLSDLNVNMKKGTDGFTNFFNNIKGYLPTLDDFIDKSQRMRVIDAVTKIIDRVRSAFEKFGNVLKKLFGAKGVTPEIQKLGEKLGFLTDIAHGLRGSLIEGFVQGIERLANLEFKLPDEFNDSTLKFDSFVHAVQSGSTLVVQAIVGIIDGIKEGLKPKANSLIEEAQARFKKMTSQLKKDMDDAGIFDKLVTVVKTGSLVVFIASFKKFVDSFGKVSDKLSGVLTSTKKAINDFRTGMKVQWIKEIAIAIGILAGSLWVIAQIDSDKLWASVGALGALSGILGVFVIAISKLADPKVIADISKASFGMIAMATSMLILSKALENIASMRVGYKKMFASLGSLVFTMIVFVEAMKRLTTTTTTALAPGNIQSIHVSGLALIEFAGAIWILSKAMSEMGKLKIPQLLLSAGVVAGFIKLMEQAMLKLSMVNAGSVMAAGFAMIEISAALGILAIAMAKLSYIDGDKLATSLVVLGAALAGMAVALYNLGKVSGKNMLAAGAAMMEIATALTLLVIPIAVLGLIPWSVIEQGLKATAFALAGLVVALGLLSTAPSGGMLAAGGAMILVATALTILLVPITAMGLIPWPVIEQGLKGVAIALALFVAAGLLATPAAGGLAALSGAMIAFSAATAIFGVGLMAIGIGLVKISLGLAALSALSNVAINQILKAIERLVTGLLTMIPNIETALVKALVALGSALLDGFNTLLPKIAETINTAIIYMLAILASTIPAIIKQALMIADAILNALVEYTPTIIDHLVTWIIQILDGLASRAPELTHSIANFCSSFLSAIINEMKKANPEVILEALKIFALVAGLMYAAQGLGALLPGALIGIAAAAAVVAEISLLLAAIGQLTRIPGLQEFVEKGGDLLQAVGTALGQFVGGLVGGFAKGFTSQLPGIGQDLTDFMNNAQGFINGAKKVDAQVVAGTGYLVDAVLKMAGAQVIDGIYKFLGIGTNMDKFGESIKKLGDYMAQYGEKVANIKPYSVEASAHAAEMMANLSLALSDSPAIDEGKLTAFGEELKSFGPIIAQYAKDVADVTPDAVEGSVNAAKMISDMAKTLPNSGGALAWWVGDNSLAEFGKELASFAPDIRYYSKMVSDVTPDAVQGSVDAAKMIADMATNLPNSGGTLAKWIGDNTLSMFGKELVRFGPKMRSYASIAANIKTDAVEGSASAIKMMVDIASIIPNSGGLITAIIGDNTLSKFGKELVAFAPKIVDYSDKISNANLVAMNGAITEIRKLAELAQELSQTNGGGFSAFANGLKDLANAGIDKFVSAFTGASTKVQASISTFITTVNNIVTAQTPQIMTSSQTIGSTICTGLIAGITIKTPEVITKIQQLCKAIITNLRSSLPPSTFNSIAQQNIMQALITGMQAKRPLLMQIARNICTELITTFKTNLSADKLKPVGEGIIKGIADGIKSKENELKDIGVQMCKGIAKGIEAGESEIVKAMQKAIKKAVEAAKKEADIKSPSRVMRDEVGKFMSLGVAEGLLAYSDEVASAGSKVSESAVEAMKSSIRKISDMIESDMDVQPTITPVLDLSNIQNGSKRLNTMLTKGLSTSLTYTKAIDAANSKYRGDGVVGNNNGSNNQVSNNYNFTQNNYSPKALSRKEIYRQTKNQFSQLKGMVSGA